MSFRRLLIGIYTKVKYYDFVMSCKNPQRAQRSLWINTYKSLHKERVRNIEACLEDNLITELTDYTDYFNRDKCTGINVLNGEKNLFWAQSAGTTGKQKIFPITSSYQKQFQRSIPPFLYGLLRKFKKFMINPSLYLAATDPIEESSGNIPIGYISNYNYHNIPKLIKGMYALPDYVFENDNTFKKQAPLYTLSKDLGSIFAVTPLSIDRFIREIIISWDENIFQLENEFSMISRERLTYLKTLDKNKLSLKKIWPNLEFVCCWKTSICLNQLKQMEDLLGDIPIIDAIYSATEGWINVPMAYLDSGGPIHPKVHCLEFIEVGKEIIESNLVKLWELEKNKEYEIFITNMMGLVRYRLKDIIKCTGYFYKAPIIHFSRKESSSISLGLVTIEERELVNASLKFNLELNEYKFYAPNKLGDGLCYYAKNLSSEDHDKLRKVDEELKRVNDNYNKYTSSKTMMNLQALELKKDRAISWHGQTKPRYLFQEFPEALL